MLPDAADADADMNADRTGFDFVLMNANVALDENHIPVFVVPGLLTRAGQHSTDMQTGMQTGIFGSLDLYSRSIEIWKIGWQFRGRGNRNLELGSMKQEIGSCS